MSDVPAGHMSDDDLVDADMHDVASEDLLQNDIDGSETFTDDFERYGHDLNVNSDLSSNEHVPDAFQHILNHYLGDSFTNDHQLSFANDASMSQHLGYDGSHDWFVSNLNAYGIEGHSATEASSGDVFSELLAGRQVILTNDVDHRYDSDLSSHHGNVAWVKEADFTDPNDPQLVIVNSSDPLGSGVSHSLPELTDNWGQGNNSYYATDHPPAGISDTSIGFDHESGFFSDAMAWIKENAPAIASTIIAVTVGEEVGDITGNHVAGVAAHFATDKGIEKVLDSNDGDDTANKLGIAALSEVDKLDLLNKI